MDERSLHVEVHYADAAFWAQITEWPGCFAAGKTLDELVESLREAISVVITPDDEPLTQIRVRIDGLVVRAGSDRQLQPTRAELPRGRVPAPPLSRSPHREWGPFRFRRR